MRVPFADVGPIKIPEGIADEDAVLLTDALPTGYFGAEMGDIRKATRWWCSAPGRSACSPPGRAWLMGAGRVIVVDHLDYRLREGARRFAYAETINFTGGRRHRRPPEEDDRWPGRGRRASTRSARGGRQRHPARHRPKLKLQGGSPVALNWAINSVRKGGNVSVVGVYGPIFSAIQFGDAMNKGLTLRMNQAPVKRQWPRLFEHIHAGPPRAQRNHHPPHPARETSRRRTTCSPRKLDNCIKPLVVTNV